LTARSESRLETCDNFGKNGSSWTFAFNDILSDILLTGTTVVQTSTALRCAVFFGAAQMHCYISGTDGSCARKSRSTVRRSFIFVFVLCVRQINVNFLAIVPNWHVKGSNYGSVGVLRYDEVPCFACQLDILGEWYVMFSVLNAAGLRSETALFMITSKILLGSAQRCWNLLSGIN